MTVVVLMFFTSPALAELHALDDIVPGHPGLTYGALLRQAVPALKQDGDNWTAAQLPPFRHLLGKDYDNGQPGELSVFRVDVQHVREAGRDRLLLITMDSGGQNGWFSLLAVFDDAKKPKLLDAANFAADQYYGFWDKPSLHLTGGNDAILVTSTHSNSNQAYAITSALTLRGGKLRAALSIFTLNSHACTINDTQELSFIAQGNDIVANVEERSAKAGEDCTELPGMTTVTYTDTWRWNAKTGRYAPTTHAFDRLAKKNMSGE